MSSIIQVIGVSGFIGSHVFAGLSSAGVPVVGVSRSVRKAANLPGEVFSEFDALNSGAGAEVCIFPDTQVVVFCAGMAHVQNPAPEQVEQFVEVNCNLPVRYAKAAIEVGVRRFVYLSSIGVHGDGSVEPYTESSAYAPRDDYSRSKVLAEQKLIELFRNSSSELVIIRPPMVYGAGAPGNFSRLTGLVRKGIPLPLGGLVNPRSFLFIENLVSFIVRCTEHPNAGGKVFVVSDDDDVTTRDFVRMIASAQNLGCLMFPLPVWLFRFAMALVGQGKAATKLAAPLVVDCSYAKRTLNWVPPYSLEDGVRLSFLG